MKVLAAFMGLLGLLVAYVLLDDPSASGGVAGSPSFLTSYESAMSRAKASGKPAVLIFSASWCGPCQMMKKEVYPSVEVSPYKERFVWAYLDVDQSANQAAAQKFGVRGIPAIFIVSPDGKVKAEQVGGSPPAVFAAKLAGAAG